MTHLYSCRHEGDLYRITKLTTDLDVESSYLVGQGECQCPGFERRHDCRHLSILARFLGRPGSIENNELHNFERSVWVNNPPLYEGEASSEYETWADSVLPPEPEPTLPEPLLHRFTRRY